MFFKLFLDSQIEYIRTIRIHIGKKLLGFRNMQENLENVFFLHVNRRSFFLFFQVTHQVLLSSNVSGQTLLTLIEVNRESLSESLPLVLKREYGCHRRDMRRTELCLSEQLETSASASEIIVVRILNERVTV